jgi:hypothetical protein
VEEKAKRLNAITSGSTPVKVAAPAKVSAPVKVAHPAKVAAPAKAQTFAAGDAPVKKKTRHRRWKKKTRKAASGQGPNA